MNTEEAEEITITDIQSRGHRSNTAFLKISKAMAKDPLHKKITAAAKRQRDDEEFDEDESLRYAI